MGFLTLSLSFLSLSFSGLRIITAFQRGVIWHSPRYHRSIQPWILFSILELHNDQKLKREASYSSLGMAIQSPLRGTSHCVLSGGNRGEDNPMSAKSILLVLRTTSIHHTYAGTWTNRLHVQIP
ncbi:hypothetical protein GGR57DRAFT_478349 [Xylariaceae sp. FL1272]|nr:hypothetical protein GGR57DRAFT_478349 [Xylariaceae sp. FL1272]